MWKDRQEVLNLAKEFMKICKENKILYTEDKSTLLGAIGHKVITSLDDDFWCYYDIYSFRDKTRFAMQCIRSKWRKFNLGSIILWVISLPFKWIPKIMTYQALNILSIPTAEATYFYKINNLIDPVKINKKIYPRLKKN